MERRIIKVPDDTTWEDFRKKFWGFFPISSEAKRIEKLESEFERLTGRKAYGKTKGVERKAGETKSGSDVQQSHHFGKGSRKRGNEPEHGSTVRGDGLRGEESPGL